MMLRKGNIVACLGLMGSGKTMGMVRLAYSQPRPIVANFPVQGAQQLRYFEELYDMHGVCILYDELQLTVDARAFSKQLNTDLSHFLELRVRKRNSLFIYTTQDFERVDVNVRRITSHLYAHSYVKRGGVEYSLVNVFKRDMMGSYTLQRKFRMPMLPWFQYYDTHFEDVVLPVNPEHEKELRGVKNPSPNVDARSNPPARRVPQVPPSGVSVRRS